jgi:hypothetical protein
MQCPMLNSLSKEGWRPRDQGIPMLSGITGKCIAAGLGIYNNYRKAIEAGGRDVGTLIATEKESIAKTAMDVALAILSHEIEQIESIGYVLNGSVESYLSQMQDRICKPIVSYIMNDPLDKSWRIVDVERPWDEYGGSRPDLIVRDSVGLAVVDYKTKVKAPYGTAKLNDYTDSHQMKHYTYFGGKVYNEPVNRYHIIEIITLPYSCQIHSFEKTPESLALWYQATVPFWQYMEDVENGTKAPWMAANHETKFGKCDMYLMCMKFHLDPQMAKSKYILVEREKD